MIASAKARTTFTATPPHVPSGTQPSGSASAGVSNLRSSASAPTLADAQADQRPLELGPGALLVRGRRGARGEDLLSAVARLLRTARVDLLSVFGRVGQHDDAVAPNVHESTEHGEHFFDAATLHLELTRTQGGEERRVVREDPDVALGRRSDDHVDILLVHLALGCDHFEMKRHYLKLPLWRGARPSRGRSRSCRRCRKPAPKGR